MRTLYIVLLLIIALNIGAVCRSPAPSEPSANCDQLPGAGLVYCHQSQENTGDSL